MGYRIVFFQRSQRLLIERFPNFNSLVYRTCGESTINQLTNWSYRACMCIFNWESIWIVFIVHWLFWLNIIIRGNLRSLPILIITIRKSKYVFDHISSQILWLCLILYLLWWLLFCFILWVLIFNFSCRRISLKVSRSLTWIVRPLQLFSIHST